MLSSVCRQRSFSYHESLNEQQQQQSLTSGGGRCIAIFNVVLDDNRRRWWWYIAATATDFPHPTDVEHGYDFCILCVLCFALLRSCFSCHTAYRTHAWLWRSLSVASDFPRSVFTLAIHPADAGTALAVEYRLRKLAMRCDAYRLLVLNEQTVNTLWVHS